MSFLAQSDLIRITNNSGGVVFDTTRKMPILTSIINGSLSMPARGPNASGTAVYDLGGTIMNPVFIFPTLTVFQGSVGGGVVGTPNGVPFCANGSAVTFAKWTFTDVGWRLTGARVLTCVLSGGRVYLWEDWSEYEGANLVPSASVAYRIYVGQFA
jgi:hypothetical protein